MGWSRGSADGRYADATLDCCTGKHPVRRLFNEDRYRQSANWEVGEPLTVSTACEIRIAGSGVLVCRVVGYQTMIIVLVEKGR